MPPRSVEVLRALPDDAVVTPQELALLLRVRPGLLTEWRGKRRGPEYQKAEHQVRYTMGAVRSWERSRTRVTVP